VVEAAADETVEVAAEVAVEEAEAVDEAVEEAEAVPRRKASLSWPASRTPPSGSSASVGGSSRAPSAATTSW